MGAMKNVPYQNISEYIFKPHSDKLIIKVFRGNEKLLSCPLKPLRSYPFSTWLSAWLKGTGAQPHSTDDRRKLEESIETNSGVQYLLDHPHGKLS